MIQDPVLLKQLSIGFVVGTVSLATRMESLFQIAPSTGRFIDLQCALLEYVLKELFKFCNIFLFLFLGNIETSRNSPKMEFQLTPL